MRNRTIELGSARAWRVVRALLLGAFTLIAASQIMACVPGYSYGYGYYGGYRRYPYGYNYGYYGGPRYYGGYGGPAYVHPYFRGGGGVVVAPPRGGVFAPPRGRVIVAP